MCAPAETHHQTLQCDADKVKKAADGRPIILFSTKQTEVAGTIPYRETMQPPTELDRQRLNQVTHQRCNAGITMLLSVRRIA
jgi:hypothetical protein